MKVISYYLYKFSKINSFPLESRVKASPTCVRVVTEGVKLGETG